MQRDVAQLADRDFDVVVVGGGIHGASVARDAALRGLSVALVEQGDFGAATSHNTLKTVHGGLRYLQHLNFQRARTSIRELWVLRQTMGHLVQPLRFVMPAYGWGMRGPLAIWAGLGVYQALVWGTALRDGVPVRLARGRVMRAQTCRALAPGSDSAALTGGATWLDAQVACADQAVLQILTDAVQHGASVANYVRAERVHFAQGAVSGLSVRDLVTDQTYDIRAKAVVNATGPWAEQWLSEAAPQERALQIAWVRSMNLVINMPAPDHAIAVKSALQSDSRIDRAKRMFFMVPWQDKMVIGTTHFTHQGDIDSVFEAKEIGTFVEDFNRAYPAIRIRPRDVLYAYVGLTPGNERSGLEGAKQHAYRVVDHQTIKGLVSVIGIEWATARLVAERAVDLVAKRFPGLRSCQTRTAVLPDYANVPTQLVAGDVTQFVRTHIAHTQARHLDDMVLRRSNDLVLGRMTQTQLKTIVAEMAAHFNWSVETQNAEVRRTLARLTPSTYRQGLVAAFAGVDV